MKLSLTHYGQTLSAEVEHDDPHMLEVLYKLIIPVLLAAGFDRGTIEKFIADVEPPKEANL